MNAFFTSVIMIILLLGLTLVVDWFLRYVKDLLEVKRLKKKGIVTDKFTFRDLRELKDYQTATAIIDYSEYKKSQSNISDKIKDTNN